MNAGDIRRRRSHPLVVERVFVCGCMHVHGCAPTGRMLRVHRSRNHGLLPSCKAQNELLSARPANVS
eukprot:366300-Chlamydomonas_euryale.AAC.4